MAEPELSLSELLAQRGINTGAKTPGIVREDEDHVASVIKNITQNFQQSHAESYTRLDFLPPLQERKNFFVDVPNLMFGTEMAAVGVSLDETGFKWDLETAKDAWVEHPIRTGFTIGMDMLPVVGAIHKGLRASKLAGIPEFEFKPFVAEGVEFGQLTSKEKEIVRINAWSHIRKRDMEAKISSGVATPMEKFKYNLEQRFSNQYLDVMDPNKPLNTRAQHYNKMQEAIKGAEVHKHLADLPPDNLGPSITRYYKDENMLSKIPEEHRPWAIRMKGQGRKLMDNMESEGFITPEERAKVGDVWFSLVRRGTPMRQEGAEISLVTAVRGKEGVKLINVPRTESVHLLRRKTELPEADRMINRTEALDYLKNDQPQQALKLLTHADDEPIRGLIRRGAAEEAKAALLQTKEILDISSSDLTVKNLLQQHLLFENFRYIRDIAMDSKVTKNVDEYLALTPSARADWVNLDAVPNAHVVRRMIGKKLGKAHEEPLGYIRSEIFKELTNSNSGQPAMINGALGVIEFMTVLHKTSRTSLNVPTQLQNVGGNIMNMYWAGMNPFSKESFGLIKTSFNAAWKRTKARKSDTLLEGVGKIRSHIGGKDIDIAEEFNSGELADLLDESSFLRAEGLESIQRMLDNTSDTQMFLKKMLKVTQEAAKARIGPLSVENAADLYSNVDSAFKLAYYLHLRQRGLSSKGSALEVSRRFPIYHTVAPVAKGVRRYLFPWISFPVETMRIIKNNVTDYPLRMAMQLHAVNFLQTMMYPFMDQSAEGIKDNTKNLPTWAQKPTTVITPFRDKNDDIRAMVLDWMPHASFLPQTYAPEAPIMQKLPLGLGEPIPIIQGIIHAWTGKDSFGNDIPYNPSSPSQLMQAQVMNLIGSITPPIVGKYLMNPTTPDPTYRLRQEFGQAVSPATGKPGDTMFDFFVNNIGMPGKFYPASGEQYLANQALVQRGIETYRGSLSKKWGAYVKTGDWQRALEVATEVQETLVQQWKDPAIAQQKFMEWLERHKKGLEKHPQLRGFSAEQLKSMMNQVGNDSAIMRSNAARERLAAMRSEAAGRNFSSNNGSENPMLGGAGIKIKLQGINLQ